MLLMSTLLLTSCGIFKHDTNFYVLDGQDMVVLEQDQEFKAPFNGIYLSDKYVDMVMEAKVKNT